MRIGVAGHCETGGMAAALQELCWNDRVTPLVMTQSGDDEWIDRVSRDFDVIFYNSVLYRNRKEVFDALNIDKVRYPFLQFSAYHPDCCYLRMRGTGNLIGQGYHSGICVYAYVNNMSVDMACKIFCEDVYDEIGYFDLWGGEVDGLRSEFSECGVDFNEFFLAAKRKSPFMHSINHPTAFAIGQLARTVAGKVWPHRSSFGEGVKMVDALSRLYWPVYPEVADRFAIGGEYKWLVGGKFLSRRQFIENSYQEYEKAGVSKENILINGYKSSARAAAVVSAFGSR